jgi:hypothetical protein
VITKLLITDTINQCTLRVQNSSESLEASGSPKRIAALAVVEPGLTVGASNCGQLVK